MLRQVVDSERRRRLVQKTRLFQINIAGGGKQVFFGKWRQLSDRGCFELEGGCQHRSPVARVHPGSGNNVQGKVLELGL